MDVRRNVHLDVLLAIARTISHSALFCAHVNTTGQRNNPGMQAQVLPLTQHLIGSDFQPHVAGMHEYGKCLAMYLGVTTTIPTGGRLDMTLPPLRAVLYGPVRRPSVSRVDLTVTVFRSQIFGPFIAHTPTI